MLEGALQNPAHAVIVLILLWVRVMVCLTVCPLFGLAGMPRTFKLIIALIVGGYLFPIGGGTILVPNSAPEQSQVVVVLLLLKEAVLGLILGFVLAIPAWVAEGVGAAFDNQRGAMTGQTFNAMLTSPSTMATLLQYAAILVLYQIGAFHWVIEFIALSVRSWPPLSTLPTGELGSADLMIDVFNGMARGTVLYFSPLLAVMLVMETAMALMSVYAPQLQVFQLSMPLKSLTGLFMLTLMLGFFFQLWGSSLEDYFGKIVDAVSAPLPLVPGRR